MTFVLGCALVPPDEEPLNGDFVAGEGVTVGRGTLPDGTDWEVHVRVDRGLLCMDYWVSRGRQHGGSCSGVGNHGWAGGFEASYACGGSTFIAGSFPDQVRTVRVNTTDGAFELPVVPLRSMGLPSTAFGLALSPGTDLVSATTLDANGVELQRQDMPAGPPNCP